jgi:hypothetical protein
MIDNDGLPTGVGLFPNKNATRRIMASQKLTAVSLVTRLSGAQAIDPGCDAYGEANFSNYVEEGAALRRQHVLTREGIVLIRDSCSPCAVS